MLPSSRRIEKSFFNEIFKKGSFSHSDNLFLVFYKNPKVVKSGSRFAFSVSKKVSKKATVRNKLRRRGYSIVKNLINEIKPHYFAVFVLKEGSVKLSFDDFSNQIEKLLKKSSLI